MIDNGNKAGTGRERQRAIRERRTAAAQDPHPIDMQTGKKLLKEVFAALDIFKSMDEPSGKDFAEVIKVGQMIGRDIEKSSMIDKVSETTSRRASVKVNIPDSL